MNSSGEFLNKFVSNWSDRIPGDVFNAIYDGICHDYVSWLPFTNSRVGVSVKDIDYYVSWIYPLSKFYVDGIEVNGENGCKVVLNGGSRVVLGESVYFEINHPRVGFGIYVPKGFSFDIRKESKKLYLNIKSLKDDVRVPLDFVLAHSVFAVNIYNSAHKPRFVVFGDGIVGRCFVFYDTNSYRSYEVDCKFDVVGDEFSENDVSGIKRVCGFSGEFVCNVVNSGRSVGVRCLVKTDDIVVFIDNLMNIGKEVPNAVLSNCSITGNRWR